MKKNKLGKTETICIKVGLFFFLQLSFLFIIRSSTFPSPPLHIQEHKKWRSTLRSSSGSSISLLSIDHDHLEHKKWSLKTESSPFDNIPTPIICDRSNRLYDLCHLRLPTILNPTTSTFFTSITPSAKPPTTTEKIKPYPRKTDRKIMSNITEITLTTTTTPPKCETHHETPALVFSIGGFTGNFFHDFNDGFIPLFITINTLFPDQDVTLVITDYSEWWFSKYEPILPHFSKHPIINLANQTTTHCFESAAAGLITHGPMTIQQQKIPNKKTFLDFRALLESAYSQCPAWPAPKIKGRPRLVLVSRSGNVGRVIKSQESVIKAAQDEGFEVFVFEPTPLTYLCQMYRMINSSYVMVGVHGAALTHSLFLQPGAVLVQIVPLGNDWLAETYYEKLARGLNLGYFAYKVRPEESTLSEEYGFEHGFVKDAMNVASKNWSALHHVYLKGQDVKLDIGRFRGYLRKAYCKAKRLMLAKGLRVRRRPKIKTYMKPLVYN